MPVEEGCCWLAPASREGEMLTAEADAFSTASHLRMPQAYREFEDNSLTPLTEAFLCGTISVLRQWACFRCYHTVIPKAWDT